MTADLAAVGSQYDRPDLSETLLRALRMAGKDPEALEPDDLAPFEEFHVGFRRETVDLADRAGLAAGMRVLDVGCGIGGPARFLARRYGCTVTGVDASPTFVAAGRTLTERVGLAHVVSIQLGDALDLPFEDGSFDVVWTQHVSMNVEDKAGFYRSLRRVTALGGRLAFYDFVAGDTHPEGPILFPVMWADTEELSFLATAGQTRSLLHEAGFRETTWNDRTAEGMAFVEAALAMDPPHGGTLGLHLLVPFLRAKVANALTSMREGRLALLQAVCEARRNSGDPGPPE